MGHHTLIRLIVIVIVVITLALFVTRRRRRAIFDEDECPSKSDALPLARPVQSRFLRVWLDDGYVLDYPPLAPYRELVGLGAIEVFDEMQALRITSTSGVVKKGSKVVGGGVLPETYILSQYSGTIGGPGIYLLNRNQPSIATPTSIEPASIVPIPSSQWSFTSILDGFGHVAPNTDDAECVIFTYGTADCPTPACNSGAGMPFRSIDFTAISPWTGNITFDWTFIGSSEYYFAFIYVAALGDTTTTMISLSAGPSQISGTTTIAVTQGQPFGIRMGGSNSDYASHLGGSICLSNFIVPAMPAPFSISSTIIGGGFEDYALQTNGGSAVQQDIQQLPGVADNCLLGYSGYFDSPNVGFYIQTDGSGSYPANVVTVDFGIPRTFSVVRLANTTGFCGYGGGVKHYRIEISDDGLTWVEVGSGTTSPFDWVKRYDLYLI